MLTDPEKIENDGPGIFGFYSVAEIESIGYCGGYLVLNEIGRPIEFHCTLPLMPARSQQILYGESLRPFLLGEHIGPPLISKAKTRATLILVNQADAVQMSKHVHCPLILIQPGDGVSSIVESTDAAARTFVKSWQDRADSFDLNEPFERILSAIEEAHTVSR